MKRRLFSLAGSIAIAYMVLGGAWAVLLLYNQAYEWHASSLESLLEIAAYILFFPVGWVTMVWAYEFLGRNEWSIVLAIVVNAIVMGHLLAWAIRATRKRKKAET